MYMIEMRLNPAKLMRFARIQGQSLSSDEDFGYAVHAWLGASTGRLAPKPFRLFERPGTLRLLGYSNHDAGEIRRHAESFAAPHVFEVCDWNSVAGKQMPEVWETGRRLGFEVRACPVARRETERDVFLSALDRAKAKGDRPLSRQEVYFDWLRRSMKAACEPGGSFVDMNGQHSNPTVELVPGSLSIVGFRRVKVLRKNRGSGARNRTTFERPDVLFVGELVVRGSKEFDTLLKRGVGRHRSFGFGMLLLRPHGHKQDLRGPHE